MDEMIMLKARAYDIIAQREQLMMQLNQIHERMRELAQQTSAQSSDE